MCVSACSLKRPDSKSLAALVVAAALFTAGCATPRSAPLPEIGDWDTRTAVLGGLDEWEFSGRIGVTARDEGFNATLRWAQHGDDFQATVSGPLGIGTVRLELYKGNCVINGRKSDFSLYDEDVASMEADQGVYDPQDAIGFIKLNSLPLKIDHRVRKKNQG